MLGDCESKLRPQPRPRAHPQHWPAGGAVAVAVAATGSTPFDCNFDFSDAVRLRHTAVTIAISVAVCSTACQPQVLHVSVYVCVPHGCATCMCCVCCVRHKCQFKLAANETRLSYPHKHIRVGAIEMPTAAYIGAAQRGAPVLLLHAANKLQPRAICLHTLFFSLSLALSLTVPRGHL